MELAGYILHKPNTYPTPPSSLEMEPKGAAEKEAKEQLTTVSGMGDERGRLEMSTVGQTVFRLFFMFSELYTI